LIGQAFGFGLIWFGTGCIGIVIEYGIGTGIIAVKGLRPAESEGCFEFEFLQDLHFRKKVMLELVPPGIGLDNVIVAYGSKRVDGCIIHPLLNGRLEVERTVIIVRFEQRA